MRWSKHSTYQGQHSQHLSPSKYHWLGYDDDKFDRIFAMQRAASRGTELHDLAAHLIKLEMGLPKNGTTMSLYVNDAIGFRMRPEQMLVYTPVAFGQCDAICFRKKLLRIHDLKTGSARTSFKQLECYAALFCLEYRENPFDIKMELRIYQDDDIRVHIPDPDDIMHIMQRYKYLDKRVLQLIAEEDEQ